MHCSQQSSLGTVTWNVMCEIGYVQTKPKWVSSVSLMTKSHAIFTDTTDRSNPTSGVDVSELHKLKNPNTMGTYLET